MRVLVTGASGHIGGAIASALVAGGHEVHGLSRRPQAPPGVRAVTADLGGRRGLTGLSDDIPPCDAVVHAAAALDKDPASETVTLVNGIGTQRVVDLARQWRSRSLVLVSGVTVIGIPRVLPIDEDHPTAPLTAYHASKLYSEHLVHATAPAGCAVAVLRVTAPIGAGTPEGRIASVFVRRALEGRPLVLAGKGGRRQDYVDVADVARAAVSATAGAVSGTFNVASGRSVSNLELARTCIELFGSPSAVALSGSADPEEELHWDVSIERAADELGYRPEVTLEASLSAMASHLTAGRS
jgi:UDP-glucose 4-epimerase